MNKLLGIGIIILGSIILLSMEYTQFPSVVPPISDDQGSATSAIQPKDFTGSGSFPSNSIFNLGGPTGVNLSGNQGFWAGAKNFVDAPTSIDLAGNALFSKVRIKDSNGTAVIDSFGIVSSSQFSSGSITDSNPQIVTETTPTDITTMTLTFTVPRSVIILFMTTVTAVDTNWNTAGTILQVKMVLDGVQIGGYMNYHEWKDNSGSTDDVIGESQSTQAIVPVAAGTHTVKLQGNTQTGGSGLITSNPKFLGYVILGT